MTLPSFRLDGKVALVTGGSKGLGRAMALGFAEAGADVVVASRKTEACEAVAAEVRALRPARAGGRLPRGRLGRVRGAGRPDHRRDGTVSTCWSTTPASPRCRRRSAGSPRRCSTRRIAVNLKGPLRLTGAGGAAPAARRLDHQHQLDGVAAAHAAHGGLRRRQGRAQRADQGGVAGARTQGHPGQRHRLRPVPHRHLRPVDPDGRGGGGDRLPDVRWDGSPRPRRSSARRCSWPPTRRRT